MRNVSHNENVIHTFTKCTRSGSLKIRHARYQHRQHVSNVYWRIGGVSAVHPPTETVAGTANAGAERFKYSLCCFSHLIKCNRSRLSTLTCEHLEAMIRSQGQGPGIQKSNGVTNSRCFQKVHIVSIHILKSSPTSKLS